MKLYIEDYTREKQTFRNKGLGNYCEGCCFDNGKDVLCDLANADNMDGFACEDLRGSYIFKRKEE